MAREMKIRFDKSTYEYHVCQKQCLFIGKLTWVIIATLPTHQRALDYIWDNFNGS